MATFHWDNAAFDRLVLSSPEMVAHMKTVVDRAKTVAVSLSPVESGDYIHSFETSADIRESDGPRARGTLRNTSGHALYVEIGGKDTPAYHVLKKAILAAGG